MDPQSSVRIEIDGSSLEAGPVAMPDSPERGPNRGRVVLGLVLAGVALVAGLQLLQPADGESADGTQREAPSPTEEPSEPVEDEALELGDRRIGFEPQSDGIVRTENGFLGLGWNIPNRGLPILFSSVDGEAWTQIAPQLPEFEEPDDDDVRIKYSKLIALDDGFAMFREVVPFSHSDPTANTDVVVTRLVSEDGVLWESDTAVRPFRRPDDAIPLVNVADASISIRNVESAVPHGGPDERTALIRDAVVSNVDVETVSVCDLDLSDPGSIRALLCREPDDFLSTAFDLVVSPEELRGSLSLGEVRECADALAVLGDGNVFEFRQEGSSFISFSSRSTLHTPLGERSIAWLALGGLASAPAESDPCAPFPDVSAGPPPAAIEIAAVGSDLEVRRVPLPEQARATNIEEWPAPWLVESEQRLFAILDREVWELDLGTDEWTQLGALPSDAEDFSQFRITPDGRLIGVLADGLTVIDFATGEERNVAASLASSPRIVYLDDELALVSADFRPGTIAVRLDGPSGEAASVVDFAESDVVRSEAGFLALLAAESVAEFPSLYRSDDGVDWQPVEVVVPAITNNAVGEVAYSNLIAAGENFALLRTSTAEETSRFADRLIEPTERFTERLVSTDGERWELDVAFTPVVHPAFTSPAFHLANSFGFSLDPTTGRSRVECGALLPGSGDALFERLLLIQRFGRTSPAEVGASGETAYTSLAEAGVASFAPAGTDLDLQRVCGAFPGDTLSLPEAAIEVISTDNSVRQIPLPEQAAEAGDLEDWPEPSLFGTDDGLLALLGRSVWHLDLDSDEWTWLLDLPAETDSIRDYQIVDGRYVVGLAESVVIRADLEQGEVATNLISRSANPAGHILYADSEMIIAPSLNADKGTIRLRLPTSFFPDSDG